VSCVAVIGLGNPGLIYTRTRHNLGFWLLDKFANHKKTTFHLKSRYNSEIAKLSCNHKSCILIKPQTYMNESGKNLKTLLSQNNCDPSEAILVHDEVTLPVGRMKITNGGRSHGGHNGVKSVFSSLGDSICRLRIGIGQNNNPNSKLSDFVLSDFNEEEVKCLELRSETFLNALCSLINDGPDKTMNVFNRS
jgi:PTH1 family peptidyl-tRNA hydrolase